MIKYQMVKIPHGGWLKKYHTDAPQPQSVFLYATFMAKNFPLSIINRSNFVLSCEISLTFTAPTDAKICTDNLGSQSMNYNDYGDFLTFPLVPLSGPHSWFWAKCHNKHWHEINNRHSCPPEIEYLQNQWHLQLYFSCKMVINRCEHVKT